MTNHEADAVKRSICLTTLVKRYNLILLILLVWEGNRGSNPRMNLYCQRLDDPRPFPRQLEKRICIVFIIGPGVRMQRWVDAKQ